MVFVLTEMGAVLRGEEVPLILLTGLIDLWEESTTSDPPHIMLPLKGRFKSETGGLGWD